MKRIIQILIVFLMGINVLVHVITKQFELVLISYDLGTLMFVLSFVVSIFFISTLWHAKEKHQNIAIGILLIAYLLSFRFQILIPLTMLCLRSLVRYEDVLINKTTKILGVILSVIALGNFIFLPAVASGYQEEGFDVYQKIESENHQYILIIRGYNTSEYGAGLSESDKEPITLSFNEIHFAIFRHEIESIEVPYKNDLNYEWFDENIIKIYETAYELSKDKVIIK